MTQRAIEALRDVFGADVPENVLEGTLDLADWNLVEAVEDIYRGGDYAPVPAPATQLGALLLQLQGTGIYVTVEGLEVLTSRVGFDANAILNAYFEERDKQGGEAGPSRRQDGVATAQPRGGAPGAHQAPPPAAAASAAAARLPVHPTLVPEPARASNRGPDILTSARVSAQARAPERAGRAENSPQHELTLTGTEPSAAIERQAQLQGLYAGLSGVLTVLYGGAVGTAQQCKLSRWVVTQGRVAMANPLWDCVQYASTHMRATWAEQPSVTTAPRPQQPHSNKATQKKPRGRQPKKHTHVAKEKEVTDNETESLLQLTDVTVGKLRQPSTYPAHMRLPYHTLRDLSDRLHCTDPSEVSTEPLSPRTADAHIKHPVADGPRMDDFVRFGSFNVSVLPSDARVHLPGEGRNIKASPDWLHTSAADTQRKAIQIVSELLSQGELSLSSLTLVCGGAPPHTSHNTDEWTTDIASVAVAVLETSPKYDLLHTKWTQAGLSIHTCERTRRWDQPAGDNTRVECLVLGYVTSEYLKVLRALAVLSTMPQNLFKDTASSDYVPSAGVHAVQEQLAKVEVTCFLGYTYDTQTESMRALDDRDTQSVHSGVLPLEISISLKLTNFIRLQRAAKFGAMQSQVPSQDQDPWYGFLDDRWKGRAAYLKTSIQHVVQALLLYGSGLFVGPDTDGLLNLCDDKHTWSLPSAEELQGQGGWSEFDRICELTIKEWASMAEAECERLSALVRTWDTHMRQLAEKGGSFLDTVASTYPDVALAFRAGDVDTHAPPRVKPADPPLSPDQQVSSCMWDAHVYMSWCKGKYTETVISEELCKRVVAVFRGAGLCTAPPGATPPQPPRTPPSHPERTVPVTHTDSGDGGLGGVSAGRGRDGDGMGQAQGGGSGAERGACAGTSVGSGVGGAPHPITDAQYLPLTTRISPGLIRAAEKVSGCPIVLRDRQGWMVGVRSEDATGAAVSVRQDKLPAAPFSAESLLASVALPGDYPAAEKPQHVKTEPLECQLKGLKWMVDREQQGDAVGRGILHLDPEWVQLVSEDGYVFYINRSDGMVSLRFRVATDVIDQERVKGQKQVSNTLKACGGLLCDQMGLGKTLDSIMLIMTNPATAEWLEQGRHPVGPGQDVVCPIKTTLVVVPGSLVYQWLDELRIHLKSKCMTWGVFSAEEQQTARPDPRAAAPNSGRVTRQSTQAARSRSAAARNEYLRVKEAYPKQNAPINTLDVLLVSLSDLPRAFVKLKKYAFWRLVLDEGHVLTSVKGNPRSQALALLRRHTWVITGTPVSFHVNEIGRLLNLALLEPYSLPTLWDYIADLYQTRTLTGIGSLRSLLRGVMLRRSKAQVAAPHILPPCVHHDRVVPMGYAQGDLYSQFTTDLQVSFPGFLRLSPTSMRGSGPLHLFMAQRQACTHPGLASHNGDLVRVRTAVKPYLGELVMQAYHALDNAHLQLWQRKVLVRLRHALDSVSVDEAQGARAIVGFMMAHLAELQALNELAAGFDVRQAVLHRDKEGGVCCNELQLVEAQLVEQVNQIVSALSDPNQPSLPIPILVIGPDRDVLQMHSERPPVAMAARPEHPSDAEQAARKEAEDWAQNPSQPYPVITYSAHDPRPCGSLPEEVFDAERVVARVVDLPAHEDEALHLQTLCQTELDSEVQEAWHFKLQTQVRMLQSELRVLLACTELLCARWPVSVTVAELITDYERGDKDTAQRLWPGPADANLRVAAATVWVLEQRISEVLKELRQPRLTEGRDGHVRSADKGLLELFRVHRTRTMFQTAEHETKQCNQATQEALSQAVVNLHRILALEHKELCGGGLLPKHAPLADLYGAVSVGDALAHQEVYQDCEAVDTEKEWECCSICFDCPKVAVLTWCGHIFCPECVLAHMTEHGGLDLEQDGIDTEQDGLDTDSDEEEGAGEGGEEDSVANCPQCGQPIHMSELRETMAMADQRRRQLESAIHDKYRCGTKVRSLLADMEDMTVRDPGAKALVVSSWPRLLHLVQDVFRARGIQFADYLAVDPELRKNELRRFKKDAGCRVMTMLLAHDSGAAGLNLTEASTVFILEPSLDPSLEDQMAARVHRLGQQKETRVVRYIARDSVDQSVLKYQASRRALVHDAPVTAVPVDKLWGGAFDTAGERHTERGDVLCVSTFKQYFVPPAKEK